MKKVDEKNWEEIKKLLNFDGYKNVAIFVEHLFSRLQDHKKVIIAKDAVIVDKDKEISDLKFMLKTVSERKK